MSSSSTPPSIITVFGGSGFLGRRVTRHLLAHGRRVRVATRHPEHARKVFEADQAAIDFVAADIHDDASVASALTGAAGAVNAVSLYVERGFDTFASIHVDAAQRVARLAREANVARLVHVSGIGADPQSLSSYIRARGEGDAAVAATFPRAAIVRPSVMFGPDDGFLTTLVKLVRMAAIPLFGGGETRLQPAYVEDVGEAIARLVLHAQEPAPIHELGGPRIYRYRDLLRSIADASGRNPALVPVPFAFWHMLAFLSEPFPFAPLTRNQVELMETDNVAGQHPGFSELEISPRAIEDVLREII